MTVATPSSAGLGVRGATIITHVPAVLLAAFFAEEALIGLAVFVAALLNRKKKVTA